MRGLVMAIAGLIVAAAPAVAEEAAGRFALQPGAEGFIRLDTRTGAVSHCAERDGIWRCEPFAEETAGLEARLSRLEAELTSLRAAIDALTARLDRPAAPPAAAAPVASPPKDDRGLSGRLMGSLFGLVRALKGVPPE